MTVTVSILSLGAAPRALVIERPSWVAVLFMRAETCEWNAYAIERVVRCENNTPYTEWIWYRDSRDQQPVRVPTSIERKLEDSRVIAMATGALAARDAWRRNRDAK